RVLEREVELGDYPRRSALLRAVDRARATRTRQRVRDVAGDIDTGLFPVRVDAADVDPRQPFEREAAGGELVPVFVEEVVPERLRHAGTAVVGGAAADADDEMAGPLVVGALQPLADAGGGRDPGGA